MHKRTVYLWLTLLLLPPVLAVRAQGAPAQINAALNDLSARVGRTVALGDLQKWTWEQLNFPDTSLGCPQPDQVYAQALTVGYRFELTYLDKVYDYRVAADQSAIILCGVADAHAPTPTFDPNIPRPVTYVPPCPAPEPNVTYMRIRLAAGLQGRVTPGSFNNVRAEPGVNAALVGEIPGGGVFTVRAGPACADQLVWWQVDYDGLVGWTVEGRDGTYWLEPLPPQALPANRAAISEENAPQVVEVAIIQGNIVSRLAFSPQDSTLGVPGSTGSEGVWLYNPEALTAPPRIIEGDAVLSTLVFSPTRPQALAGGFDGKVRLYDLRPDAPVVKALELQSHSSDANAVAFHPSGNLFAVAGNLALTSANVDKQNAILLWNIDTVLQEGVFAGHTAHVNALAFSPDGARLISGGDDGALRIWDVAGKTPLAIVETTSGINAVAYSPNGQFIAFGSQDGTATLLDAASGEALTTLRGHTLAVNGVAFSPDSTLVATAGEDGSILLWSTQSDKALATLRGTFESVSGVAFSPDGTFLASASRDQTVRLWVVGKSVG